MSSKVVAKVSSKAKISLVSDYQKTAAILVEHLEAYQDAKEAVAEYDKLKKQLISEVPTNDEIEIRVDNGKVKVSAPSKKRYVKDMKKLHKIMGDTFYELVSITMKNVDDYLNPEQKKTLVAEEEGHRTVTVKYEG